MKSRFERVIAMVFVCAVPTLLAACAGSPQSMDAGQRISSRGENISARGEDWTNGQKDMLKGQKLVSRSADRTVDGEKKLKRAQKAMAEAQKQIDQARDDQATGEQLISGGSGKMQQAEAAYGAIRSGPSAVAP